MNNIQNFVNPNSANDSSISPTNGKEAMKLVRELISNEIIFAVVGPIGSGTSEVASSLDNLLQGKGYKTAVIKASQVIKDWAKKEGQEIREEDPAKLTSLLQDMGDKMREADHARVAMHIITSIREKRAAFLGKSVLDAEAIEPDGEKRAYIIDSLRNPAEVALLRHTYQESFCLIGVIADEPTRQERLTEKYDTAGKQQIRNLMERDEKADDKHGQQVSDTFHLADFFIDNDSNRFKDKKSKQPNEDWSVPEELGRLVDTLSRSKVIRPRPNETAMYHAYGTRMKSSCLSRQVGAALMDMQGNLISTGTNEVPRAGGGVYGSVFENFSDRDPDAENDHRCFKAERGYCSNTREQNDIIDELFEKIDALKNDPEKVQTKAKIRKTRIGQLIEFSRAVHAEMDALLSAARQGISPVGSRMFVTTFPCHNCARHIVAAGVDEVQFIEPYLKSKALPLHGDAITTSKNNWVAPSVSGSGAHAKAKQVLFRPFTGVAPRLYRRAFYKDFDLKDGANGNMLVKFGTPEGLGYNDSLTVSYAHVEAKFAKILGKSVEA